MYIPRFWPSSSKPKGFHFLYHNKAIFLLNIFSLGNFSPSPHVRFPIPSFSSTSLPWITVRPLPILCFRPCLSCASSMSPPISFHFKSKFLSSLHNSQCYRYPFRHHRFWPPSQYAPLYFSSRPLSTHSWIACPDFNISRCMEIWQLVTPSLNLSE